MIVLYVENGNFYKMKVGEIEDMATLLSINVSKPRSVLHLGKEISTGIFKYPAPTPISLDKLNLQGDGQADLVNHGGIDKAICLYPFEHYSYWEMLLSKKLTYGALGENFTVLDMTEEQIYIGDIFQIDNVILQVSQPRQPCFKLGVKYNYEQMPILVRNSGYSGYYMRVLQEGTIRTVHSIKLIERENSNISISSVNHILYHDKNNEEGIHQILEVKALATAVRLQLERRLKKLKAVPLEKPFV